MSDQNSKERSEKDREEDEKIEEKDEKERDKHEEKTVEEKFHRDPLGTILWAIILIWAGLVFLANSLHLLDFLSFNLQNSGFENLYVPTPAFSIVLFGAGIILLIGVVIRLIVPSYRQPVSGTIILAIIFIAISLGNVFDWRFFGAFVLIAIGIAVLLRGLLRRKE